MHDHGIRHVIQVPVPGPVVPGPVVPGPVVSGAVVSGATSFCIATMKTVRPDILCINSSLFALSADNAGGLEARKRPEV